METKAIRLRNLLSLAEQYPRNIDFCERVKMNPTYFSQIKSGKKAIGDEIARKVESLLGLDRGFMDVTHGDESRTRSPSSDALAMSYAIDSLPAPIRDAFKRLIYQVAANQVSDTAAGNEVGPFRIINEPEKNAGEQNHPLQAAK